MGISAFSTTDPANLAREFTKLGMQAIAVYGSTITGFLPLASIVAMDSLDSLEFARPVLKPIANVGLTTSAGDVARALPWFVVSTTILQIRMTSRVPVLGSA